MLSGTVNAASSTKELGAIKRCMDSVRKNHDFSAKFADKTLYGVGMQRHGHGFRFTGEWKDGNRSGKMTYWNP